MKKLLLLIVVVMFPLLSFAGHGKDGGWPQSIQLLKVAKENLLELLAQSSDQDVQMFFQIPDNGICLSMRKIDFLAACVLNCLNKCRSVSVI